MKTTKHNAIMAGFSIAAVLLLSACDGSKTQQNIIPQCSSDANDSSAAIAVLPGTRIKPVEEGTIVRVRHYSNSDKLACTVTGSAVVSADK